jgi:predicted transcriptional regulator of viral defense system
MRYLNTPYYVGLLSAAEYYGAAPQKPQIFQVITSKPRKDIRVGRVEIRFTVKLHAEQSATRQFNTPTGSIRVATPETIALDLVMFPHQSGGLSTAFEVLSDLAGQIHLKSCMRAIRHLKRIPFLQRLGYFFDLLGLKQYARLCEKELKKYSYVRKVVLDPQSRVKGAEFNIRWHLIINTQLEADGS